MTAKWGEVAFLNLLQYSLQISFETSAVVEKVVLLPVLCSGLFTILVD